MVLEKVTVNGKEVAVKDNKVTGLKTGDKVVVTLSRSHRQEKKNLITQGGIKNLKLAVSTSKNSKKNVKVNVKIKNGKSLVKDLESKGYTVSTSSISQLRKIQSTRLLKQRSRLIYQHFRQKGH